jgi:hypothetical protein
VNVLVSIIQPLAVALFIHLTLQYEQYLFNMPNISDYLPDLTIAGGSSTLLSSTAIASTDLVNSKSYRFTTLDASSPASFALNGSVYNNQPNVVKSYFIASNSPTTSFTTDLPGGFIVRNDNNSITTQASPLTVIPGKVYDTFISTAGDTVCVYARKEFNSTYGTPINRTTINTTGTTSTFTANSGYVFWQGINDFSITGFATPNPTTEISYIFVNDSPNLNSVITITESPTAHLGLDSVVIGQSISICKGQSFTIRYNSTLAKWVAQPNLDLKPHRRASGNNGVFPIHDITARASSTLNTGISNFYQFTLTQPLYTRSLVREVTVANATAVTKV